MAIIIPRRVKPVDDLRAQLKQSEDHLHDRTAELAGAHAAVLNLEKRLEAAESWRVAYKQMLRDVLDLMPAGYMAPEHQAVLMRAWDMATDGAHRFKPRGRP